LGEEWTEEEVRKYVGEGNDSWVMPVNIGAEAGQRVLNFRYVEGILKRVDRIAVGECGCRKKMRRCDHTLEGCMYMGPWYDDAVKEGYARPSTRDEALAILKRTYDDGLILVMAEADEGPFKICACCSCCCFQFAALRKFGIDHALLTSDFVAAHDGDLCTACGACAERCHFGAVSRGDDGIRFVPEKCFGCGLCVGTCPSGAQTLAEKQLSPQ
jgi:electron transport complex protein RnfB